MPEIAGWYHTHVSPVRRSTGKSSVGAVAYITGEQIKDERIGEWRTRGHPGEVLDWGLTAPTAAAPSMRDKAKVSEIWNAVERSEKRVNSHVGQHLNFALSREFSKEDSGAVCQEIGNRITARYQVLTAWAVHAPTDHGDSRNNHGHIVFNLREVQGTGFGKKVRSVTGPDRHTEVEWQRKMIAEVINERLELIGSQERVSHESYAKRGIVKEPMKHLGHKQHQAELQGMPTPYGSENREIRQRNADFEAEIISLTEARKARIMAQSQPDPFEERIAGQQAQLEMMERQKAESQRYFSFIQDSKTEGQNEQKKQQREEEANKREAEGDDIPNARRRFLDIAGDYFQLMRPYSSLSLCVGMEGREARITHDRLTKQMEEEKDPDKKNDIEMKRDIHFAEYYAITGHRLSEQSKVITGNRDSAEAQRWAQDAMEWRDYAAYLRDQRSNLHERMEVDMAMRHMDERADVNGAGRPTEEMPSEQERRHAKEWDNLYRPTAEIIEENRAQAAKDNEGWHVAGKDEVHQPGVHARINIETGDIEVREGAKEQTDSKQEITDIKARWKNDYNVEISDAKAEKIAANQRAGEESEAAIEASRGRAGGHGR